MATQAPAGNKRTSRGAKSGAPTAKKSRKGTMTAEHKAAIAEGRAQAKVVGRYLEAIQTHKPKRGRKVTAESLQSRLAAVEKKLASASPLDQLKLLQEQKDLQARIESFATPQEDISALEAEFIKIAKEYADRQGIERATFVQVGVKSEVLKAAGI